MNIVFFGSDAFAAVHLESLFKSRHKVAACVTSPDARQGRGMQLTFSPIKVLAAEHGIDYLQPETLKDRLVIERLKEFNADIFAVVAYGKLLTADVLSIPKLFCVNVHGSLLPKYRGAAPINWAILNADKQTGVTVQKMVLGLDAGDIIAQAKMNIAPDMTADVLREAMAKTGAQLLVKTLNNIEEGKYTLTPQDHAQATQAPKLTKAMGHIDWSKSAAVIYNQVRGLKPWPGTYTSFNGKILKILSVAVAPGAAGNPGTIVSVDKKGFMVACGGTIANMSRSDDSSHRSQGALLIKEVQPEAGKPMTAASFAAGHKIAIGAVLS